MACYFAVDDGLWRSPKEEATCVQSVFLKLHAISERTVTKRLTKNIRKYIPPKVSDSVRTSFLAWSMRKATLNYMALHLADPATDYCE